MMAYLTHTAISGILLAKWENIYGESVNREQRKLLMKLDCNQAFRYGKTLQKD